MISRKNFIQSLTLGGIGFSLPVFSFLLSSPQAPQFSTKNNTGAMFRLVPVSSCSPSFSKFCQERQFDSVTQAVKTVKNPKISFRVERISG